MSITWPSTFNLQKLIADCLHENTCFDYVFFSLWFKQDFHASTYPHCTRARNTPSLFTGECVHRHVQMLITDIVDVLDLYDYGCPFSQKLPSSTLVGKRVAVSIESTLLLVASRRNGHGQNSKTYVKTLVFWRVHESQGLASESLRIADENEETPTIELKLLVGEASWPGFRNRYRSTGSCRSSFETTADHS